MDFHLEFFPKPFDVKISHQQKLLLTGSCFTEQIGNKLTMHKFKVLDNPNGILFNPVSIAKSVISYIENTHYNETELFWQNECWNSWDHHSRFSHPDKQTCLRLINESQSSAHLFLKDARWLLVTLGSAFVYEREHEQVVANCHKVPTDQFNKRLLHADEVSTVLWDMLKRLKEFNPALKIIFTISPVRHLRDGFMENNRSKARLIQAVHELVEKDTSSFYFPAYELVIDDLRDYRFYAEDMVHPNYAATQYVWEKFAAACIDEPTLQLMRLVNEVNAAMHHRPFNPASDAHRKFLQINLEKVRKLAEQYPYMELDKEMDYFS